MKENTVKQKSFLFAVRIVNLNRYLNIEYKEYTLSKQLLRSGAAVGALIREAEHAESKTDFKHKMAIAQKEINESIYWLDLLKETKYLSESEYQSIIADALELIKLITSIIKTTKKSIATENSNKSN